METDALQQVAVLKITEIVLKVYLQEDNNFRERYSAAGSHFADFSRPIDTKVITHCLSL